MRTGAKVTFSCLGIIVVLAIVFGVTGLALGWFRTATEVVSPANVKAQHEQVIGKYESMIAAAGNACTVQGSDGKSSEKSPTLVESPVLAYEATFRRIVADYNASVDNLFKAGIVAPPGYPESVDLKSIDTTDWCTVPDQLIALR
jgi:hypothetical protein